MLSLKERCGGGFRKRTLGIAGHLLYLITYPERILITAYVLSIPLGKIKVEAASKNWSSTKPILILMQPLILYICNLYLIQGDFFRFKC